MRGLFSARALALLEARVDDPITDFFNAFAGTSIGGIIAVGLATGIRPAAIEEAIRKHGQAIFKRSRWRFVDPLSLWHTPYSQAPLRAAIVNILGDASEMTLGDLTVPLVVPALDFYSSAPVFFASAPIAPDKRILSTKLIDVCLATSAAPTYLPPHRVDEAAYVDGGLVANSPDMIAAQLCVDATQAEWDDIRILSVGTAAAITDPQQIGNAGRIDWLTKHNLFGVTIDALSRSAIDVARERLGNRHYRLDYPTPRHLDLDDASAGALDALSTAADEAVSRFARDSKAWARFMINLQPPSRTDH